MKKEFKEEQKFTQWWLWVPLIGIGFIPIYGIYKQLFLKEQFGTKPMSDLGLIIFLIIVFSLILLFACMRLKTVIDNENLRMSFFPFIKKNVIWDDIKNAKIVDYGFVGGWGIRLGTKYGTIYNISGSKGLAIELKNGKKFLIGT
ncbi:hypothetical protein DHD05_08905 [Arenibacter sp. N53]|uniref:hypothetical protein n=1 Tax=Arenibacter TaxID=178469 RepID=UPI000CD3DDD7|nr:MULTISPECIES: hypothetical protein [Arenibacter]MCM4151707.1 hypothetical protein [Arenibacter sp. N53]